MERIVDQLTNELRDLRIRIAQLETAAAANEREDNAGAERAAAIEFREGDRVRIKNKLKRPAVWPTKTPWNKELAQRATVTHIYREQVQFVTDNGVKTWRAMNNIELITEQTT